MRQKTRPPRMLVLLISCFAGTVSLEAQAQIGGGGASLLHKLKGTVSSSAIGNVPHTLVSVNGSPVTQADGEGHYQITVSIPQDTDFTLTFEADGYARLTELLPFGTTGYFHPVLTPLEGTSDPVGPEGGMVSLDSTELDMAAILTVPAGAVSDPVRFSLGYASPTALPRADLLVGQLQPQDGIAALFFLQATDSEGNPVTAFEGVLDVAIQGDIFPASNVDPLAQNLRIFSYIPEGGWIPLPGAGVSGAYYTFSTDHLSCWAVALDTDGGTGSDPDVTSEPTCGFVCDHPFVCGKFGGTCNWTYSAGASIGNLSQIEAELKGDLGAKAGSSKLTKLLAKIEAEVSLSGGFGYTSTASSVVEVTATRTFGFKDGDTIAGACCSGRMRVWEVGERIVVTYEDITQSFSIPKGDKSNRQGQPDQTCGLKCEQLNYTCPNEPDPEGCEE